MKSKIRLYKIVTFLLIGTLINISCTKLTESPRNVLSEENFNPTSDDLLKIKGPIYTNLRATWANWYGLIDVLEETTDILVTPTRYGGSWYDGGIYIVSHKHEWTSTQPEITKIYDNFYNGVNTCNRVIYQIESGKVPVDNAQKPKILAEVKAVRAFYYFLLLDNFGNVPFQVDFVAKDLPGQISRVKLYDFVVKELTDALPLLTEDVGIKTYGLMTKWAAQTILADVYLNAEVFTGTPQYAKVIIIINDIIASGKFKLSPNYKDNFVRSNSTSPEIIWAVVFDEVYATGNQFHMKTGKPNSRKIYKMNATPWGGSAGTPQFLDTYDNDDSRKSDCWAMGPQMDATTGAQLQNYVNFIPSMLNDKTTYNHGYPSQKYEFYEGMTSHSSVDVPIYRYSKVLLMKAEALLRTGQVDQAATIVSNIRQRNFRDRPLKATVTGEDLKKGSSYKYGLQDEAGVVLNGPGSGGDDILFGRFLDELGWEFPIEALRRRDLIRFGVFSRKAWYNKGQTDSHDQLFPIPQTAIESNLNLKQNPGYN